MDIEKFEEALFSFAAAVDTGSAGDLESLVCYLLASANPESEQQAEACTVALEEVRKHFPLSDVLSLSLGAISTSSQDSPLWKKMATKILGWSEDYFPSAPEGALDTVGSLLAEAVNETELEEKAKNRYFALMNRYFGAEPKKAFAYAQKKMKTSLESGAVHSIAMERIPAWSDEHFDLDRCGTLEALATVFDLAPERKTSLWNEADTKFGELLRRYSDDDLEGSLRDLADLMSKRKQGAFGRIDRTIEEGTTLWSTAQGHFDFYIDSLFDQDPSKALSITASLLDGRTMCVGNLEAFAGKKISELFDRYQEEKPIEAFVAAKDMYFSAASGSLLENVVGLKIVGTLAEDAFEEKPDEVFAVTSSMLSRDPSNDLWDRAADKIVAFSDSYKERDLGRTLASLSKIVAEDKRESLRWKGAAYKIVSFATGTPEAGSETVQKSLRLILGSAYEMDLIFGALALLQDPPAPQPPQPVSKIGRMTAEQFLERRAPKHE